MRHVNPTNALMACIFALAMAGCSQKSGTPDTSATSAGAAADVATREQEIAAKEQELAAREAALKQEEEANAQAKAEAEAQEAAKLAEEQAKRDAAAAAASAAAAKAAAKPATKTASTSSASKAPAAPPAPIVVPAGTQIGVVLSGNVNTKRVVVGTPVQGTLASDLVINGRRAAKAGAAVQGTVTNSVSGSNKIGGVPALSLRFDSLVAADGSTKTINATYSQEGVSETGKDTAKIVGGTAAGAIIGHQVSDKNGAVIGGLLGAGAGAAAAKKTGGEVKLTAGSVLTVTTQSSFEVKP